MSDDTDDQEQAFAQGFEFRPEFEPSGLCPAAPINLASAKS